MDDRLLNLMAWIRAHEVPAVPGVQDSNRVRFPDGAVPASSGGMNPYATGLPPVPAFDYGAMPSVEYAPPTLPPYDYIKASINGDGPSKKKAKK